MFKWISRKYNLLQGMRKQTKWVLYIIPIMRCGLKRHERILKKQDFSYSSLEARGFMLPLYEMNCIFKNPAKYEDEILVITKISFLSQVRLHLSYQVINSENSKLLVTGETMHAWTDKTFKPVNVEKAIPDIYLMLNRIFTEK